MNKIVKVILIILLIAAGSIIAFFGFRALFVWDPGMAIEVVSPDSSTVWRQDDYVAITWTWSGEIDHVNIWLKRPSYSDQAVVLSTQCDGLYYWTIPWNQEPATNYLVKVESELGDAYDESNDFTIRSATTPPPPTTTTPPPTTTPPTTTPPTPALLSFDGSSSEA